MGEGIGTMLLPLVLREAQPKSLVLDGGYQSWCNVDCISTCLPSSRGYSHFRRGYWDRIL